MGVNEVGYLADWSLFRLRGCKARYQNVESAVVMGWIPVFLDDETGEPLEVVTAEQMVNRFLTNVGLFNDAVQKLRVAFADVVPDMRDAFENVGHAARRKSDNMQVEITKRVNEVVEEHGAALVHPATGRVFPVELTQEGLQAYLDEEHGAGQYTVGVDPALTANYLDIAFPAAPVNNEGRRFSERMAKEEVDAMKAQRDEVTRPIDLARERLSKLTKATLVERYKSSENQPIPPSKFERYLKDVMVTVLIDIGIYE